ncbi:MAG TPA: hypothetical protein VF753_16150 [Terriglobales bacterium]
MSELGAVLEQLRKERSRLAMELKQLDQAITALSKLGIRQISGSVHSAKRTMSAAARRKISLAQKARWATRSADAQPMKPKPTITAAGRKKIAAFQRARWAKFRAMKRVAA